jgi:hypothetical protein
MLKASPSPSHSVPEAPGRLQSALRSPYAAVALSAAGMWLATRLAFVVFTYFGVLFNSQGFVTADMGLGGSFYPSDLLQSWNRWDTGWYLAISDGGYGIDFRRAAFFPMFPMLVHAFTWPVGNAGRFPAALVVANLAALGAFIGIALLAAREKGLHTSTYAVLAFAAYPFAFYTAAAYPEGLFIALAAFTLLFARRGQWLPCAVCAFLAALTRPTGLALVLPLLWEYARQSGLFQKETRSLTWRRAGTGLLVLTAVPLAVGLFGLHLWDTLGTPLAFFRAQADWAHTFVPPWDLPGLAVNAITTQREWSFNQARILIDLLPGVAFFLLILASIRRLPTSFVLYMLGVFYTAVASPILPFYDPFASLGRYMLAAFPAFILLGDWASTRPWLNTLIVSTGFMLQSIFAGFFLMGGWMI